MPLLEFWKANPESVLQMGIQQIVMTAGEGKLRDKSEAEIEFRSFLGEVSVEHLAAFADQCLVSSFTDSGLVLQDVVNELGRRLEYDVENGRYQGTKSDIGHDGLWIDPNGSSIVVEVKTTDAYRMSLEKLSKYRDRLIDAARITSESSILLVVGRNDTGELEAQVRGSRHSWDIRLISVDALVKMVLIKERADAKETVEQMREILRPMEFTRLDGLVDIVFSTTRYVETAVAADTVSQDSSDHTNSNSSETRWEFTPVKVVDEKRSHIVDAVGLKIGQRLIRNTRAMYWSSDKTARIVCTVSKRYTTQGATKYWYAYHLNWHEFLLEGTQSFFVLGCVDMNLAFAIPVDVLRKHLPNLNTTPAKEGSREYYHIKVQEPDAGDYYLYLTDTVENLSLNDYQITWNATGEGAV